MIIYIYIYFFFQEVQREAAAHSDGEPVLQPAPVLRVVRGQQPFQAHAGRANTRWRDVG